VKIDKKAATLEIFDIKPRKPLGELGKDLISYRSESDAVASYLVE
jgi:hypothetical protein